MFAIFYNDRLIPPNRIVENFQTLGYMLEDIEFIQGDDACQEAAELSERGQSEQSILIRVLDRDIQLGLISSTVSKTPSRGYTA